MLKLHGHLVLKKITFTPCLLGTAGGDVEFESGDLGGRGGKSADSLARRAGCGAVWSLLLFRPEAVEPDEGEFFLFIGTGAPAMGGVGCRGLGRGAGPGDASACNIGGGM